MQRYEVTANISAFKWCQESLWTGLPGALNIVLRGHRHGRVEDNSKAVLVSVKDSTSAALWLQAWTEEHTRGPPTVRFCTSSFKRNFSSTTLNPHTFSTNKVLPSSVVWRTTYFVSSVPAARFLWCPPEVLYWKRLPVQAASDFIVLSCTSFSQPLPAWKLPRCADILPEKLRRPVLKKVH